MEQTEVKVPKPADGQPNSEINDKLIKISVAGFILALILLTTLVIGFQRYRSWSDIVRRGDISDLIRLVFAVLLLVYSCLVSAAKRIAVSKAKHTFFVVFSLFMIVATVAWLGVDMFGADITMGYRYRSRYSITYALAIILIFPILALREEKRIRDAYLQNNGTQSSTEN